MRETIWTSFASFALALAALCGPAQADIHKWVDEDGNVHYSDQPPPASVKNSFTFQGKARPVPGTAPSGKGDSNKEDTAATTKPLTPGEQEMEFKKRRSEQTEKEAKAEKENQETQERKRNCELARGHYARMQRGGLVTSTNSKGEITYMDEKDIAEETERARKQVEHACKG